MEGNLYIACLDPSWITGTFQWRNARLEVNSFSHGVHGDGFVLTDPAAQFELRFGKLEVRENVKLKPATWRLEPVSE